MLGIFKKTDPAGLLASRLYDNRTFYDAFARDLRSCREEAVIESPFIAGNRVASLLPIFAKMRSRNIRIVVNTRHPSEHEAPYDLQAQEAITRMQDMGIEIFYTGGHHRKLAIFDKKILWEGSLNILSQHNSCEVMRRISSSRISQQMIRFTGLDRFLS